MLMKTLMGYRHNLNEPIEWALRHDSRAVFYRIQPIGEVKTPDGLMLAVEIRHKTDLANPQTDVAVLVGFAVVHRKSGVIDPQSPELWFWNDKFWLKAADSDGTPYYRQKRYLFYEVKVQDSEKLLASITTGFDKGISSV